MTTFQSLQRVAHDRNHVLSRDGSHVHPLLVEPDGLKQIGYFRKGKRDSEISQDIALDEMRRFPGIRGLQDILKELLVGELYLLVHGNII